MITNHATTDELSEGAKKRALQLAHDFVDQGVPVFIAARRSATEHAAGKSEFAFPRGWQELEPSHSALNGWTPHHAVCAVTGVQFDVIDVDPRHNGDKNLAVLRQCGFLPPVYGEISTPSGGQHLYVARSGRAKGTPVEGIDLQAGDGAGRGRGFVYITPTWRTSKATGEVKLYMPVTVPDIPACRGGVNDPATEPWLKFLHVKMPPKIEQATAAKWVPRELSTREVKYLETTMQAIMDRVATTPEGARNDELNRSAYRVGQLIAGCGMPEEWAKAALMRGALASGMPKSQASYTINRSVAQGTKRPIAVGPFAPESKQRDAEIRAARQLNADLEDYISNYDAICEAARDAS